MGPGRLHRVVAVAEAVTWGLLLLGMVLKYLTRTTDVLVSVGGALHGFVFLAYLVTTVLVAVDGRWGVRALLLGLGSAVPPFTTLVFEAWARGRGLLSEQWRLRGSHPQGPVERVVGLVLRRPVLAGVVTLLVLAVVFAGLVRLGPPTTWVA